MHTQTHTHLRASEEILTKIFLLTVVTVLRKISPKLCKLQNIAPVVSLFGQDIVPLYEGTNCGCY